MSRMVRWLALILGVSLGVWSPPSPAQEPYPSRTVRIVVPSAPGSTTDILARLMADRLSRKWGKPAIVENMAGGSMNIGAGAVARSAPDGYTLMVAPPVPLAFSNLLHRNAGYDPAQFVAIAILATIPNVLVVRKDLPAANLKELVEYGKLNPGKLTYASGAVGSTAHLTAAQLEVQTGIKMVHVMYRGAQPALSDIVAGHVDMFFDTLATSVPFYRDKMVRLLAIPDSHRAAAIPDVPTFAEAGIPDFKSITWFGLVAPPGTPPALAETINRDVVEVLRSEDVGDILSKISLEPAPTSPAEAARFIAEEAAHWGKVIKDVGIEPQ